MKKYRFFFHYNKPASKAAGMPQISIHYRGKCHLVDNVVVNVDTRGKIRKSQPRFVICGKGLLEIQDGVGVIT